MKINRGLITGTTDSDGNLSTDLFFSSYYVLSAYAAGDYKSYSVIAGLGVSSNYWKFHVMSSDSSHSVASSASVTIYYFYLIP